MYWVKLWGKCKPPPESCLHHCRFHERFWQLKKTFQEYEHCGLGGSRWKNFSLEDSWPILWKKNHPRNNSSMQWAKNPRHSGMSGNFGAWSKPTKINGNNPMVNFPVGSVEPDWSRYLMTSATSTSHTHEKMKKKEKIKTGQCHSLHLIRFY